MPANLEKSAVVTGLEKISFHFNPKEGQCQRMFKLPHATAAKSLLLLLLSHFSRVRLCDPMDGSPPGIPVLGILQISIMGVSSAWKNQQ